MSVSRLIGAALATSAIVAIAPAAAQDVGIAASVKNDVRIRKPAMPLPRPAVLKQHVALNDQVQTGVKSQLQVLLLDKSVFNVGANARLVIDRFVYDPRRGTQFGASVVKGAFRFMSGKSTRDTGSSIRTPIATIGIRGTIVDGVVGESAALIARGERAVDPDVQVDPATASLIVLRGPGPGAEGGAVPGAISIDSGGRSIVVTRPAQAVFVPREGAAPIGPFPLSRRGMMQLEALIFPVVSERLGLRGPADNLGGDPNGVYYPPAPSEPAYPGPDQYPLGAFPPRAVPGSGGAPPSMGPGSSGLPNLPSAPPPRQRPATTTSTPAPTATQGNGQQSNAAGSPTNANNPPPPPPPPPPPATNPPPKKP